MFEEITFIRDQIIRDNQMTVFHGSHKWIATFEWSVPNMGEYEEEMTSLKNTLPADYLFFVNNISNGCVIFHDSQYGQWGFKVYSLAEIMSKQDIWKERFTPNWKENLIVFAELFGEGHSMVFDLSKPTTDRGGCSILEGNPIDPISFWPKASRSFHEWLNHLFTAQGDKYWNWK